MTKIRKIIAATVTSLMTAAILASCGGSSGNGYYEETHAAAAGGAYYEDYEVSEGAYYYNEMTEEKSASGSASEHSAKIIYTATLDLQSTEFDTSLSNIDAQVSAVDGAYYESRSVDAAARNYRTARMVVRVPVDALGDFVDSLKGAATVVSEYQNAQDVSDSYYDIETRLSTARTKLARLQALLAEAEDMSDIIVLEEAISETEYEIDDLQGSLKYYDSKITYSTVTITLSEVSKVTDPEKPVSFGDRLAASFRKGLEGFAEGIGNLFIWLAGAWLWLLIFIVIPVIIVIIIVTSARRRRRQRLIAAEAARQQKE